MRTSALLLFAAATSACAARPPRSTLTTRYDCGDLDLVRRGETLAVARGGAAPAYLGWRDRDGDHFVAWPVSPLGVEAVDVVVPDDPRQDAVRRVYDASKGASSADWRLVARQVCPARGGYSEVLARYLGGDSLDHLAADLTRGDRDEARAIVHRAMVSLERRYYHDR
jgi:hypothetical protein